jgi:lantibiotic modifying enzyme
MLAWCHGAPGIALSRLSAWRLDPGALARHEVETAITTTWASPVQRDQSLCHGELGNLMIAHRAATLLDRRDWQGQVGERLRITLERLFECGPECGVQLASAAPALMNGIAGIGYGLLYLARPFDMPFVLDLSPRASISPAGGRSTKP